MNDSTHYLIVFLGFGAGLQQTWDGCLDFIAFYPTVDQDKYINKLLHIKYLHILFI